MKPFVIHSPYTSAVSGTGAVPAMTLGPCGTAFAVASNSWNVGFEGFVEHLFPNYIDVGYQCGDMDSRYYACSEWHTPCWATLDSYSYNNTIHNWEFQSNTMYPKGLHSLGDESYEIRKRHMCSRVLIYHGISSDGTSWDQHRLDNPDVILRPSPNSYPSNGYEYPYYWPNVPGNVYSAEPLGCYCYWMYGDNWSWHEELPFYERHTYLHFDRWTPATEAKDLSGKIDGEYLYNIIINNMVGNYVNYLSLFQGRSEVLHNYVPVGCPCTLIIQADVWYYTIVKVLYPDTCDNWGGVPLSSYHPTRELIDKQFADASAAIWIIRDHDVNKETPFV